ncbi:MAG: hypothetical protein JW969_12395 [Spirochaetales bacterium]|nr:hypothetical protein [Spirochaetales bacterium]
MTRINICLLILFISFPLLCQTGEDKKEPEDPQIILPNVILDIEDLSVEKIEATLPEEEDVSPMTRDIPLEEEELNTAEQPDWELNPDFADTLSSENANTGPSLFAEAIIGAGNVNNIFCRLSFAKIGDEPRYRFLFDHKMLDGYSFQPTGLGYSLREDYLEAYFKLRSSGFGVETNGSFFDAERGLQQISPYFSEISRFLDLNTLFTFEPITNFRIHTGLGFDLTQKSLTAGAAPAYSVTYPPTEMLLRPTVGTELEAGIVKWLFNANYGYRNILGGSAYELHRLSCDTKLSVELPLGLNVSGQVGYFYSALNPVLVPFEIAVWGNPVESVSFRLSGGYAVEEVNMKEVFDTYPYAEFPSSLNDNHGWTIQASTQFNMGNTLLISLSGKWMMASRFLKPSATQSATGLLVVNELPDIMYISTEGGIQWNLSDWFHLNFKDTLKTSWEPALTFINDFLFEAVAGNDESSLGCTASAGFRNNFVDSPLLPLVGFNAYYRIADFIKISLDFEDILFPLLGGNRYMLDAEPFITEGIKGSLMINLTF